MAKQDLSPYPIEEAKRTYGELFGTTKDGEGDELAEAVRSRMTAKNGSKEDPDRVHVPASFSPDLVT